MGNACLVRSFYITKRPHYPFCPSSCLRRLPEGYGTPPSYPERFVSAVRPSIPSVKRFVFSGGFLLSIAKTGKNQFIRLSNTMLLHNLYRWSVQTGIRSDKHFFPVSYHELTSIFRSAISSLGLEPSWFTFHSVRDGGATHAQLCRVSFEYIRHKGRWASAAGCKRYLKAGEGLLSLIHIPVSSMRRIQHLQERYECASKRMVGSGDASS